MTDVNKKLMSYPQEMVMQDKSKDVSIVYVVDDDRDVREGLKSLFELVGMRVQAFGSTADFLRSKRVDGVSCLIWGCEAAGNERP